MTKKQLLERALRLSIKERARLAHDIIASIDGPPERGVAEAWAKEIDRRADEVLKGTAKVSTWKAARKRILKRLGS